MIAPNLNVFLIYFPLRTCTLMVVVQKTMVRCRNSSYNQKRPRLDLDCITVGFFFAKSVKKSAKGGIKVLRASLSRPLGM